MVVQELHLIPFHSKESSDEDWDDIIRMQIISFQENNPNDPLPPKELLQKQLSMLEENPFFTPEIYILRKADETTVGQLIMAFPRPENPEYEDQKHMGLAIPFILPDHRRQGFGRFLLEKATNVFRERGLTLIQGDTSSDAGRAFAENFGATVAIETRINRLYCKDIDWDLIEGWCDECSKGNPNVKIEMFEGLPDEADIESFAHLMTEVANQQPFEELEGVEMAITPEKMRKIHEQEQERGDIHITRITREADGAISGVTEIIYNPQRPHLIRQDLTGVQENYRGRGLGKWLKADMLLYIREQYSDVEYIDTGNATSNAPMLSINERMGFKLHRHNTFYKLQIEEVMKQLGLS